VEPRDVTVPLAASEETPAVDLHVRVWDGDTSTPIVMLHEGLGSVTQWRSLPADLAETTGRTVIAFDRGGHGSSSPIPAGHDARFMHREAVDVLPRLLAGLDIPRIESPVLVGHSDGASIALIATATGAVSSVSICTIAPHVYVEEVCLEGIRVISHSRDQIVAGLARHHDRPDLVFDRWRDVWLSADFRDWNIEALLPQIVVPVTAVQGDRDEYATDAMLASIDAHVAAARVSFLPDCGHVAHRDQPAAVLAACVAAAEAGG